MVVADRSSVLQEALLTGTIPVRIDDWHSGVYYESNEFIINVDLVDLSYTFQRILDNLETYRDRINIHKKEHFVNLGNSAESVIDILDQIIDDGTFPDFIEPKGKGRIYGNLRLVAGDGAPSIFKKGLNKLNINLMWRILDDYYYDR